MNKASRLAWGAGVFGTVGVAALAAAWWLTATPPASSPGADPGERPEADVAAVDATATAVALIAAESTGDAGARDALAPIEAPPGFVPGPLPNEVGAASNLPEGFEVTTFHGAMSTSRMTALDAAPPPESGAGQTWLATGGGVRGLASQAMAAGRDWTFGWVAINADADRAALARRLDARGADVLGTSGTLLRARLPGDLARLEAIAELPGVAALGPTPLAAKLPAPRGPDKGFRAVDGLVPTFVTLMAADPDGRWRQALTDLGGVVGAFDPAIRMYAANFPSAVLETVAAADFVLSVEPVGVVKAAHSTAVPAMGADALRTYDTGSGLFSGIGGGSVPIGVMDSGLNIRHEDIGTGRRSICGANFATFLSFFDREEDQDLWVDAGLHGTHVTGTLAGNGTGGPQHAGMAPLVQDIRFAKVLTSFGVGSLVSIMRGMDFMAEQSTCGPSTAPAVRPLVVNMSLARSFPEWDGKGAGERKLDASVWNNRQLYVVAQSNDGFIAYSDFASAKNSLAVGAVEDGGDLAHFSSHGPTADGRLKPQVVGTGVAVYSVRGEGRRSGYVRFSGTSMASPAVAGVAALLMDAAPEYREQPAAVRARLMASAIRPDAFLDDVAQFPLHNGDGPGPLQHRYGLGKVSARTSVLNRDAEDGWFGGAAVVEVGDGEYGYRDIEVPAGASRLDIVMTWDEQPADTVASTVLNDLDLWVDRDADCAPSQPAACGEAASRSTKDNVEWLILRDPLPGTYRLKVVPKYARTDTPRAAVAWTVIRGPSTPQLAVSTAPAAAADPGRPFEVDATVTTDGYVAAGTTLRVDCRGDADICERVELLAPKASSALREDAVARTLDGESGDAIALGEVAAGEQQTVKLMFKNYPSAARFRLFLTASAWNAASASTSVDVVVGEPDAPAAPAVSAPGNDNFAAATELAGDAGSLGFDLLLATPEPGEPAFAQGLLDDFGRFESQRRPRSLWYRWISPMTGLVRFAIPGAGDGIGDDVQLDVFEAHGLGMPDLEHIGVKFGGGLTFAARRGQTYVVRLAVSRAQLFEYDAAGAERIRRREVLPLSLHWQRAALPANDDFELATELAGASGEHAGSNLSATEQAGERLQPMAASTWHRWTAPADGDYGFRIDRRHLNVTAFTGAAVDQLRLVSGEPGEMAVFPARAGEVYTIAVAAHSAYSSGSDYTLSWGPEQRAAGTNDDMADAEPMLGAPAFFHFGFPDLAAATVEPGEPVESGVRTAWWTWTAPLSSRYTWRVAALFDETLAVSVVEVGDSLVPLDESSGDRQTEQLLSFDAVAGRQYLISAGLPINQGFGPTSAGPISFEWGPAPANDELATAGVMAGVSGTVLGSNQFATVADGEAVGLLGDSSVWWTWDVPETRWYRVSLADRFGAGVVSAFEMHADGTLGPEPVAVSRRLPDSILVFRAQAGERYALRIGTDGTASGGEFALNWAPNGSPTWLKYAGAVADGDVDPAGNILDLGSPASIALNDDGGELYVATESGLQVYARRTANGALSHVQTLDGVDESAALFWDAQASAVIAVACSGVQRFASVETGGLDAGTELAGVVPCIGGALPPGTVLRDASGTFVHFVGAFGIVTLRFNEDRTGVELAGGVPVFGITAAALGSTDEFLYVATAQGLQVFLRDVATGALAPAGAHQADMPLTLLLAERTGRHLFGVTAERGVAAFDLADPAAPTLVAQSEGIERGFDPITEILGPSTAFVGFGEPGCTFADTRQRTMTIDVLCRDLALSRRLMPGVPTLRQEELLHPGGVDAFDNNLPFFSFDRGLAATSDGRHIYASAARGIMIFERAGSR